MKIFMTGATGFIGGQVARQLRAQGHAVVAVVRDPSRAQDLAALGVDLHAGDVSDRESLRNPMTGADGVFHLAAWYRVGARDRSPAARINIGGTRNVLELMGELGIPRGVYTSTLAVFSDTKGQVVDERYRSHGPWLTEYDRTKWMAHYEVAEPLMRRGLPLTIVQPGVTYGPGDTGPLSPIFLRYLRRRLRALPRGTAYCWGHVEDTARGHLLALEKGKPGESYIIAGPPHTLVEAFEIAEEVTGIPAPRFQVSPWVMKTMAGFSGLLEKLVPLPEGYSAETLRVAAGATYLGSNAKARRDLGFDPRPLRQGFANTLLPAMKAKGFSP